MQIRIDLFVHGLSTHEDEKLNLILKGQGKIMTLVQDLNAKVDGLTTDVADLSAAIDALIASDAKNFEDLKAALAANDPVGIQAAMDKIDASRTALVAAKDKVTAADAADNLP